jgi:pimeloyl-ACP methyl ester carboxylesterase
MQTVTSTDGTTIAYDRLGNGPTTVILVTGAMCARNTHAKLAELLSEQFTVINYDRRGRGDSGDTKPFSVQREIEDIGALIAEAGGAACLYGISSGGALVLEAAASGLPVSKLAVYEIPYFANDEQHERGRQYVTNLTKALADGRRGDAVDLFMGLVGLPAEMIAGMHHAPHWPAMEAIAPTLPYDAAALGMAGGAPQPEQTIASIDVPALVLGGGASDAWLRDAQQRVAKTLPNGEYGTLDGQTHEVSEDALAPALVKFFS